MACLDTTIATTSHRSFVFYVVADVGCPGTDDRDDSYRPLAVTYRQGHGPGPCRSGPRSAQRVDHVVQDCARIINALTEPANRVALEAELALAAAWYSGRGGACHHSEPEERVFEIPDAPQPGYDFSPCNLIKEWDIPGEAERPELSWAPGTREFPFVSSCLRLALNRDGVYGTRLGDVQEQPLETIFCGDKLEYGMVVVDISDLDSVRYGIIGSEVSYIAEISLEDFCAWYGWDALGSPTPDRGAVPQLEEPHSRLPLSGTAYMKKYRLDDLTHSIRRLEKQRVVNHRALSRGCTPQEAASLNGLDIEAHREAINHPTFQARLLAQLNQNPTILGPSPSKPYAQLLRLAYAGHSHLNWVAYPRLTYSIIAAALESAELRDAQALSICIDHLDNASITPLLETLSRRPGTTAIRDLCFLQSPARTNDDKSSHLFTQICTSPFSSHLLGPHINIFLTGAFSAPLRRQCWLTDPTGAGGRLSSRALASAFPVQHMFVRQQLVGGSARGEDGPNNTRFRPCHFFLGDALLKPARFVAGFLQYCRSVVGDRGLFSFAAAPAELRPDGNVEFPGTAVSPIPAENFAIPERCPPAAAAGGAEHVECWPLFQALEPGGWVLVVSHEWHTTPETRRRRAELESQGLPGDSALGVPFVRYAFLRARRRITWPDIVAGGSGGLEGLVGPEYIQVVGGVKEFLRETAPEVDGKLVDACFDDAVRVLRKRWPAGLDPGMEFISLLEHGTARSVLSDFLQDAVYVRENLRMAMQAMPREQNWYPELLAEPSTSNIGSSTRRNSAVFKSLYDPDVQGRNPAGTDRPVTLPMEDEDDDL